MIGNRSQPYVCKCVCICSKDWVIERASEVFSLVMKTHIASGVRIHVVTSNKGVPGTISPPPPPPYPQPLSWVGIHTKKSRTYYPMFKSIKSLDGDRGMMVWTDATMSPFNVIPTRSTLEIQKLYFHLQ